MKRHVLSVLLGWLLIFSLAACSGGEETPPTEDADIQREEATEPVDLTGAWEATNGNQNADGSMAAKITGESIEVVWVMEGESSGWDEWLYWSGSYAPPSEPGDAYTWVSETDGRAATAILGSSAETKEFEYKNGVLYFDVTMQGTTVTVEMERTGDVEPEVTAGSLPPEGAVGEFYVKLNDCSITTDYEGKDAIIVDYSFTNSSEETVCALVSVLLKAFQDGVELDLATVMRDEFNEQKDLRPGTTIDGCQAAFLLTSDSPVEVEVSDIWNDPTVGKIYEVAG